MAYAELRRQYDATRPQPAQYFVPVGMLDMRERDIIDDEVIHRWQKCIVDLRVDNPHTGIVIVPLAQ